MGWGKRREVGNRGRGEISVLQCGAGRGADCGLIPGKGPCGKNLVWQEERRVWCYWLPVPLVLPRCLI